MSDPKLPNGGGSYIRDDAGKLNLVEKPTEAALQTALKPSVKAGKKPAKPKG